VSRKRDRLVRWILYCVYAVALVAVLAYFRFPSEQFRHYCERQAETLFAGSQCEIGKAAYVFPFGLRLSDIALTGEKAAAGTGETVMLQRIDVVFSPGNPGREYGLSGDLYSGTFDGKLRKGTKPGSFTLAGLEIRGVDLWEIKSLQKVFDRELKGELDYSGTYSAEVNNYFTGALNGKVRLNRGSIALRQKLLELEKIDVQQMEADLEYTGKKLQVKDGRMRGKEVSSDFSATIAVVDPWMLSSITMTGNLAIQSEHIRANPGITSEVNALRRISKKQTIHFSVKGSMQNPAITLGY
jgi:type II secretion system protein N